MSERNQRKWLGVKAENWACALIGTNFGVCMTLIVQTGLGII